MAKLQIRHHLLMLATAILSLAGSHAQAIEVAPLSSNYDTWIRQSNPTQLFVDDAISTWLTQGPANTQRYGVVQFNISGITSPINSAWIDMAPYSTTTAVTLAPAFWVDSSIQSTDLSTFDWATYSTFVQPFENTFESLGGGTFAAGGAADVYLQSTVASAADLAALNNVRLGDGIITMIFAASSGKRDWDALGAGGTHELPFQLVINEHAPVAGDLNGDFLVNQADYTILKQNWLLPVTAGTNGDLNGDGTVSLADFVLFKQDYNVFNGIGSASALAVPVPEPHSLVLMALAVPAWALLRVRRKRRS